MEKFSDFEKFLIENNFGVKKHGGLYTELFSNPIFSPDDDSKNSTDEEMDTLNHTETFILENDFQENPEHVDHSHLLEFPLYNSLRTTGVEKAMLNDFEDFLLRNEFSEEVETRDHVMEEENTLFMTDSNEASVSTLFCKICSTTLFSIGKYLQHMSACRRKQHRRKRPKQGNAYFRCHICTFKTRKRVRLEYQEANIHRCQTCAYRGSDLRNHSRTHQRGGNSTHSSTIEQITTENPFKAIKAFRGYVRTYRESGVVNHHSLIAYFDRTRPFVKQLVAQSLHDIKACKMQFSVFVTLRRYLCKGVNGENVYETINTPMNSRMLALLNLAEFNDAYDSWCSKISSNVSIFERYGSGWVFSRVTGADLRVGKLLPQRGGCWYKIPTKIANKKSVINVLGRDMQCFKWAVLAGLHHSDLPLNETKHKNRSFCYKKFENLYDFNRLEYPVDISSIQGFEQDNNLAINVFSYDWEDGILPVYISKNNYKGMRTVDLLYMCDANTDRQHYATITNIHRLLGKKNNHRRFLCYNCLNTIPLCKPKCNPTCKQDCKLLTHTLDCTNFKYQRIKMPNVTTEGDIPHISFKNFIKQLRADYVVYADFESLLVDEASSDEVSQYIPYTEKQQSHLPCGFGYAVVDANGQLVDGRVYRGADAVNIFLNDLSEISKKVFEIYEDEKEMTITPHEQAEFELATHCHICELVLNDDRVRDHDHRTGLYRGAAHNHCNMGYFQENKLPVIMHNFRGYDSHFVVEGFHNFGEKVNVVPTNSERYMSLSVDGIVFIDSLQFLNCSLDTLVKHLAKDQSKDNFNLLQKVFPDSESLTLLKKKGVYPYDYFKDWAVFEETSLPSQSQFYNRLKKESLNNEEYEHAKKVFKHFECRHLGDYHDIYLMTDVLLLGCVFESFREVSLSTYKLDPVHYISAPGLAWDAALKMTGVKLEQLTDIDMYEFFESGKRGGVSVITKRKAEANNKYMSSFLGDESCSEQKYIISWDMNNLYGIAMRQKLPVSNFRFLSEQEISELNPLNLSEDSEDGYVFECDLEYKTSYHYLHNDYPLAPERRNVNFELLSDYQKRLSEKLNIKYNSDQEKLIPHLGPRLRYKVHYRNLKYYLNNGMTITKIHRVLTFKQTDWLAPYIDFNTNMRANAKNKFETDFFKLMNNSVYGKGMENVRKRMSVKLVNKWDQAKKLIRKPQYISHDILHKNLCSFRMEYGTVKLDKAIYTGFAVLELSKLYMYEFHYEYVKKRYGSNAQLLYTDTDSLAYEITTCDVYRDMLDDIQLFDTSEYPKNHFLYSTINKKVLGKMHDEANGEIVFKFVGLAPKVYCMVIGELMNTHEKKALRGVPKYIQERSFKYDKYVEVLEEEKRAFCKMNQIRSSKHKLSTVEIVKSVLHGFDSKRFILDDGIHTLAWGHISLNK